MKRVFGQGGPSARQEMYRRTLILPLVVVVSVGMAACGGGDKKLSKADLSKKANAICKKTEAKGRKITEPANLQRDPVAAAAYFDKLVPIGQEEVDGLTKLKPADDIKDAWDQFIAREKQANATLRTMAKPKDQSGLQQDSAKFERIVTKMDTEAAAVGATSCGGG